LPFDRDPAARSGRSANGLIAAGSGCAVRAHAAASALPLCRATLAA